MKNIKKAVPILASALTAGAVAWGAAASLGRYVQPVYGADEFQIAQSERQAPTAEPVRENVSEEGQKAPDDAPKSRPEEMAAQGSFDLADGDYPGMGTGFRGPVKVSVNIREKKIASIDVLSHSDDEAFFNRAKEGVIGKILSAQSLEVDAVSGATYSSNGILAAVKNALTGEKEDPAAQETGAPAPTLASIGQGNFDVADGTYQGTGQGFRGEVKVSVGVQNKTIRSVDVLSHLDDESFFNRAREGVVAAILSTQSLEVDAVSGATYSSRGILGGVKNALTGQAAEGSADSPAENPTPPQTPGALEPVEDAGAYKDGSYTGTGTGFGGALTVRVKISGGKIKSIKILKHSDGEAYVQKASSILQSILRQQGTNVDAVSGATYSSAGILEAVRDALSKAAVSQEKKPRPTAAPKKTPTPAKTPPAQTPAAPSGKFPYPDGIYQGVGEGFGGDIVVTVAIQNKAIREIQVTSHEGEDEAFFNRAKAVLAQVVQKQDIQVDAVSGATYSSRGILEGIAQAIEAAKKAAAGITPAPKPTETPKPIETPTGTPIPSETPAPETPGGLLYIDGEYTASALCLPDAYEDFAPYNLTLTLAVQGDQITAIKGISGDGGRENESYIKRAADGSAKYPGVVSQILERNSLEGVDAVSHATCSSQSILEACRQALEAAKKQPENGGEE